MIVGVGRPRHVVDTWRGRGSNLADDPARVVATFDLDRKRSTTGKRNLVGYETEHSGDPGSRFNSSSPFGAAQRQTPPATVEITQPFRASRAAARLRSLDRRRWERSESPPNSCSATRLAAHTRRKNWQRTRTRQEGDDPAGAALACGHHGRQRSFDGRRRGPLPNYKYRQSGKLRQYRLCAK